MATHNILVDTAFIVSGALGDVVSQCAKAYRIKNERNLSDDDIHVIYVRDSVDDSILDKANHLTRDYSNWVHDLVLAQGWSFELLSGNQKDVYEQLYQEHPEYVYLGPNQVYDDAHNIWEESRQLFYGQRPHETQVVNETFPTGFKHEPIDFIKPTIGIQVRFAQEFSLKRGNAAWDDVAQLLKIIKLVKGIGYDVCLIGETQLDIKALRQSTNYQINTSFSNAYNHILSCHAFIGLAGFMTILTAHQSIPTLCMLSTDLEYDFCIPANAKPNMVMFKNAEFKETFESKFTTFIERLDRKRIREAG